MIRTRTAWWVTAALAGVLLAAGRSALAQEEGADAPPAESGPTWESLPPGDLLAMVRELTGDDAEVRQARLAVAEHIQATYLKDAAAVRLIPCWDWKGFAECLGGDLAPETRAAWAEGIVSAYAGTSAALREMPPGEMRDVAETARILGAAPAVRSAFVARIQEAFSTSAAAAMPFDDVNMVCDALNSLGSLAVYDLFLTYVEGSAEWRSFEPEKLGQLAWRLDGLTSRAAKQKRLVAEHIVATYAGDADRVRAVGLAAWPGLTRLGRELPAEARQAWAKAIKDAFVPDASMLSRLPCRDVVSLLDALDPLDPSEATSLACTWFTTIDLAQGVTEDELGQIAGRAVHGPGLSQAERESIPKTVEAFYAARVTEALGRGRYANLISLWEAAGNLQKVQEWTMTAYQSILGTETARETVATGTLDELAEWLYYGRMTGKGKAYPAFAQALAGHARRGTLESQYPNVVGAVLGTPETRQVLRNELLDAEGLPRLGVVRVLAAAYGRCGEAEPWCAYLEGSIARTQGDAKAMWLLARAYSETAFLFEPDPSAGRKWLDQVMAAATSDSLRFKAVEALVRGAMYAREFRRAADLLESVAGQFAGPESGAVDALRREITAAEQQYQLDFARYEAAHDAEVRAAWERELERRLEEARQKGDAEAIARYGRLLSP